MTKISAETNAVTALADGDKFAMVDVSDTTDGVGGTSGYTTPADINTYLAGKITIMVLASMWEPEDGAAGPTSAVVAGTNHDYRELLFDGASTETAFFHMPSPKSWDHTTSIDAVVTYAPKGTSSGNVRWQLSALAGGDGDTIDAAFGTAVADDSAAGAVANVQQRSGTITFTPGGTPAAEDVVFFKLERLGGHANDTNTDDCALLSVAFKITTDTLKDD